jgi:hypothetical protein
VDKNDIIKSLYNHKFYYIELINPKEIGYIEVLKKQTQFEERILYNVSEPRIIIKL